MTRLAKHAVEHAAQRVHATVAALIAKEVDALPPLGKEPTLTYAEKHKLIATGKAKLKAFSDENDSYTKLYASYEYPAHEKAIRVYREVVKHREAIISRITARCTAEGQAVLDQIMFSDAAKALDQLSKFVAKAQ